MDREALILALHHVASILAEPEKYGRDEIWQAVKVCDQAEVMLRDLFNEAPE